MKTRFLIRNCFGRRVLFLFFLSLNFLCAQAISNKPEIFKIIPNSENLGYKYQLKNGLKLIVVPDYRNSVAKINFILDAGSNREHLGTTGLAHFFEHMMFRKAKNAPEGNYDKVLNSIGGMGNAGTSNSFVTFYSTFPSPAIETMLKLESDRFLNLDISEPYFSIEKGAVLSERKLRLENDPIQSKQELIRATIEKNTPLEWMTIGAKADVENMTLQSAAEFYNKFYTPDNTLLVIGGPFQPQNIYNLVEKYFGHWQGQLNAKHFVYPKSYFTENVGKEIFYKAPISTQLIKMVYPAQKLNEESSLSNLTSFVYFMMFQTVLNSSKDGTFERQVSKLNLASNVNFSKVFWENQISPIEVNFNLSSNQNFLKVKKFWLNAVQDVLKTSLTKEIMQQLTKQIDVSNAEDSERMTSLVDCALYNEYYFHDVNASTTINKIIKTITKEKFDRWVMDNLNPNKFYVTGVIPQDEKKN